MIAERRLIAPNALQQVWHKIGAKFWNTVRETWYLGFTSFGGPPVHFKIFHDKFVQKLQWIDEQLYQELFSVCQAFSGPGSTKMLYCIILIHDGFLPAVLAFLIWSLPGALGMFGLAVGVSNIGETLPRPVYALLSGLNAATVGIVALAAVQLSQKAITDKLTRTLVFLGAAAGLLYNALWYFPLLMLIAGIISVIFDFRWLHRPVKFIFGIPSRLRGKLTGRRPEPAAPEAGIELPERSEQQDVAEQAKATSSTVTDAARQRLPTSRQDAVPAADTNSHDSGSERAIPPSHQLTAFSWKAGVGLIVLFLVSFIIIVTLRGALNAPPLLYRLFANLYLAGTIIFGGGPVVIPLLREYIVFESWVSPRDFLIGLALIQSFPGPNFNFAVYLGALTASNAGFHPALGALLGWLAIFVPGLVTVHGTMGIWGAVRGKRGVKSALRGVNAAAVGLIYTAVYRLWGIGWIDEGFVRGISLAEDPWWVVVTATSYVGGAWYGVDPPVAIVMGAVLGLVRYAVVDA
ncbi:chromate transporter-domain-containing protein [Cercophora newfieldiana]|uniref:Chromate transporter-domain-containing protein n=1 Tax=Cercophora newfieldiana TaxID=92897 RepID=A0AA39YRM7_9PEZI|nr:chromate transporter-domain-containing protein [Cercophora newfieldiana]